MQLNFRTAERTGMERTKQCHACTGNGMTHTVAFIYIKLMAA